MTPIPSPSSLLTPTADNVQMDVDSDSEAEQVAREFAQAQERLRIANEARERHREEQKRLMEEEAQRVAEREAEELLEMEWQFQLQVSTGVLRNWTWYLIVVAQKNLE